MPCPFSVRSIKLLFQESAIGTTLFGISHGWPPRHEPQGQRWRAISLFAVDTEQPERDQSIVQATHQATAKPPVA